jgi:glucose-6-phosphate 1-dehydrogenase
MGTSQNPNPTRVVIFGTGGDLTNRKLMPAIYNHHLGKETVQNILVFCFANTLFDPIRNRKYIENLKITVTEKLGVENSRSYYDHAVRKIKREEVHSFAVRGQYGPGWVE